jgi:hypothetical protein
VIKVRSPLEGEGQTFESCRGRQFFLFYSAICALGRERQRLFLTEAGRDYLAVIRDAFDQIAIATERLLQRQRSGVLTVSTSP